MKVVLDTNVLVSGLLQPFGLSGQIVSLVASGELVLCHDARILAEYREVLLREKFRFDPERIEAAAGGDQSPRNPGRSPPTFDQTA